PPVLATCAWAAIPVSLVEFWAVARGRSSARLAVGMFSFVSFVLAAAYLQAFYAAAVLSAQSLEVGLTAVEKEVKNLTPGGDLIFFVYAVQCQALACTLAMLRRMPDRQTRLVTWTWIGFGTLVPTADWLLLASVGHAPWGSLAVFVSLSVVMLVGGSALGTVGLLCLYALIDRLVPSSSPRGASARGSASPPGSP
ncbi:MAG TPA: hypothetical protein VFF73_30840, partial [Planctomycetota bacterium]|nr:hypothetical protein [Planctomycetota bacterium]